MKLKHMTKAEKDALKSLTKTELIRIVLKQDRDKVTFLNKVL